MPVCCIRVECRVRCVFVYQLLLYCSHNSNSRPFTHFPYCYSSLSRASRFLVEPAMHHVCIPIHLCLRIHRRGIKLVAASSHPMTSVSAVSHNSLSLRVMGACLAFPSPTTIFTQHRAFVFSKVSSVEIKEWNISRAFDFSS